MTTFTESQARERLPDLLEQASAQGEVRIRRGDGREFVLRPADAAAADASPPTGPDGLCLAPQRDLTDLAGTWVEDPAFDDAIAGQRRIDPEDWK